MKIKEIYQLAVKMGIEADPRGKEAVDKVLAKAEKAFKKVEEEEKEFFDQETLSNPYADTRILAGDPELEVKKVICGVDIESGEIAVTATLNDRGAGIDLIIAHHPEGAALAALPKVMGMQSAIMAKFGVAANVAESLMDERIKDVDKNISVTNHLRAVHSAQLLNMPLMCVHTPCDNLVTQFMTDYFEAEAPDTVDDVVKAIRKLPEYKHSALHHNPPRIVSGKGSYTAGKIFVDFTGGTGGNSENPTVLGNADVNTIVCMHASDAMVKAAQKARVNMIIAGHIASDNIGLNLFLDQLAAQGVEIVGISGLIRHSRNQ